MLSVHNVHYYLGHQLILLNNSRSAVFLAEAGYEVTVIAAHVPGDQSIEYTSPWYDRVSDAIDQDNVANVCIRRAGAHWRTSATPAEPMVCDWDIQTYEYWLDVLERETQDRRLPKSGLKVFQIR